MKPIHYLYFALSTLINFVTADTPSKPNLVVILFDDLGYGDIGPFGSKLNRTPNLDRMAAEGMKLTSFYTAPVCSASRAQLMTGCYAKRVSISGALFPVSTVGLNPKETTIAEYLKQQGYATQVVGKWHLGDQPEFLPTRQGFDHFFGIPYSNDMGAQPRTPTGQKPRPPLPLLRDERTIEAPPEQHSLTERFTDESLAFIRSNRQRPFFLYLAHIATHVPLEAGKAFRGKSANGAYGDWVEEADWSVGRILEALREMKLERSTLVVFTSDNGPWISKGKNAGIATPLRGSKFSCWEGGMRVPAVAWWPGKIPAGAVSDAVTSGMDLLPTAVGLAGGKIPADRRLDGKDLWPLLSGREQKSPHDALCYWDGLWLAAVRAGEWKLQIRPQKETEHETGGKPVDVYAIKDFTPRLYNLQSDPGETTDLAASHPDVVKRLQDLIRPMDEDLGLKGDKAPGIRPPGRVEDPQPLLLKP